MSFIFGSGTGQSYEDIKRNRRVTDALLARNMTRTPRNVGEGLHHVGRAFLARNLMGRADASEAAGREAHADNWGSVVSALMGGQGSGASGSSAPVAQSPDVDIANDTMRALGRDDMVQGPDNWDAIRADIFAGESGGDYDALYGYSNRPGGKFANVKLTDMTVDDALAFAAPSGEYGQHVKGQIGRVATPMGAYQIVGTTLREAKRALGLTGKERMTPELQEKLGQHIYQTQGTGAWEGYRGPQSGGSAPGRGSSGNMSDILQLAELASSPYASPGQQAVVNMLIQQQMQANDPMRQMQLQKGQLELQQMQNPQAKLQIEELADGRKYYIDPTGQQQPRLVNDAIAPQQEAPKVQTLTMPDGSEAAVQWDSQTGTWAPIDAPEGGGTANPKNKLTENQAKLTLFQTMMGETAPVLEQLEQVWNPAQFSEHAAGYFGAAGNYWKSPEGRQYAAGAAAWAEGALRIATGAAATQPEIERTVKTYFAQPGDDPATVDFKKQLRGMYARAIQAGLGETNIEGELKLPDPRKFAKDHGAEPAQQATGTPQGAESGAARVKLPQNPFTGLTASEILEKVEGRELTPAEQQQLNTAIEYLEGAGQ